MIFCAIEGAGPFQLMVFSIRALCVVSASPMTSCVFSVYSEVEVIPIGIEKPLGINQASPGPSVGDLYLDGY